MATVTKPIALDESFNTTELTPRNIADVLAEGLSHITGRTASEVEYDNTDSGLTADNVQDALDEIVEDIPTVPSVDIQTAVDEFTTINGGLLSSLKVALSPIQDLHGYSEPWVGGANENKADFVDGYSISPSGEVVEFVGRCATVNPITIEANTTYYVKRFNAVDSGKFIYAVYNGSTLVRRVANIDNNTALDTSGGDKLYVCAYDGTIAELLPMVTKNTLPTAYSPYSNICPISGHTQAKVGDDGKNWLKNTASSTSIRGIDYTVNADGTVDADGTSTQNGGLVVFNGSLPNGNYILNGSENGSASAYTIRYNINGGTNINVYSGDSEIIALTDTDVLNVEIRVYQNAILSHVLFKPMIRLASDTDSTFKPYNGYQVTVNLGGTYYSGTLDVVSGVFVPDTAGVDLGTLTWTRANTNTADIYRFQSPQNSVPALPPARNSDVAEIISDSYSAISSDNTYTKVQGVALSTTDRVVIYDETLNTADATTFTSAMSDKYLVYKLANPTPIQLSPTMVKALVGENHLSAPLDGQEITESEYKQMFTFDDVIAYIQSLS